MVMFAGTQKAKRVKSSNLVNHVVHSVLKNGIGVLEIEMNWPRLGATGG
jgi:hypothetical protein